MLCAVNQHCLVSCYAVTSIHQDCKISLDKILLINFRLLLIFSLSQIVHIEF